MKKKVKKKEKKGRGNVATYLKDGEQRNRRKVD